LVACVAVVALLGAGQPPTPPPTGPAGGTSGPPVANPPGFVAPQPGPGGGPAPFVPPGGPPPLQPAPRQFDLKFDTKASAKDLLPVAPKAAPIRGPVLTDDLKKIPEIDFQAAQKDNNPVNEAARQIAKINHVNAKKTDAFMSALLENRPDLTGMPFVMGDDCRSDGDRLKYFTQAAQTVRQALGGGGNQALPAPVTRTSSAPLSGPVPVAGSGTTPAVVVTNFLSAQTADVITGSGFVTVPMEPFWKSYATLCEQEDTARGRIDKETVEHVTLARIAALTQMLAAESPEMRLGLVKYLTGVPHVEATKALARMAIFSPEDDIRAAAITALKVRREKDYTDVLVKGLRYPWPAVARRAADAITKLERTDLVPELVAVLESTDPRLPATKDEGGKKVSVVREMVKMNHHRNCLMCHAPNGSGTPNPNAITAEVAVQGQPLPLPFEGYRQSTPELMIRLDVTYLRQDFSATMPVKDAHPWPEGQRFDFFVRERKLTDEEAASYRDQLAPKEAGVLSPYHKAAVTALRELTGKDTAPTAEAWRKLLNMPRGE
jgi:hypothetical protein